MKPNVVLGVGGGIAAYKVCDLLRRLTESGHSVRVVPTEAALRFVGVPTWAALSGEPVTTSVFDDAHEHAALNRGLEPVAGRRFRVGARCMRSARSSGRVARRAMDRAHGLDGMRGVALLATRARDQVQGQSCEDAERCANDDDSRGGRCHVVLISPPSF